MPPASRTSATRFAGDVALVERVGAVARHGAQRGAERRILDLVALDGDLAAGREQAPERGEARVGERLVDVLQRLREHLVDKVALLGEQHRRHHHLGPRQLAVERVRQREAAQLARNAPPPARRGAPLRCG
jgi:hypothetical protein